MAKTDKKPEAGEPRAEEAADVEQQQAEAEAAAARREAEAERAQTGRKTYPKDAEGPPPEVVRGGETAYPVERLVAESDAFLGHPSYVAQGALHGSDKEYLTVDQARDRIESWLETEV